MRLAVKFAYDGRGFSGFARQPGRRTIEGDFLQLLTDWGAIHSVEEARFRISSRTDKDVSALGNVIALTTHWNAEEFQQRMPGDTPGIIIYGVREVDDRFYPRYALQRDYRYYLRTEGLNCTVIRDAADVFLGEHDFRNFAKLEEGKDPVRCLDSLTIGETNRFLVLDFTAQTFLWHQVRRMVAGLIRVGFGKLTRDDLERALLDPDTHVDFGLAPAEPLILRNIVYPFAFTELTNASVLIEKLEQSIRERLS